MRQIPREVLKRLYQERLHGSVESLWKVVYEEGLAETFDESAVVAWVRLGEYQPLASSASYTARQVMHTEFKEFYSQNPGMFDGVRAAIANGQLSEAFTLVAQLPVDIKLPALSACDMAHAVNRIVQWLQTAIGLTEERREWLLSQYVLTLVKDQDVRRRVKQQTVFTALPVAKVCVPIIRTMMVDLGDFLTRADLQYIIEQTEREMGVPHTRSTPVKKAEQYSGMKADFVVVDELTEVLSNQPKEIQMNKNVAFETVNYVYGTNVKDMSEAELIEAIKQVEAEIAKLDQVKTASKKITAKKDELNAMLANIVETLDAK